MKLSTSSARKDRDTGPAVFPVLTPAAPQAWLLEQSGRVAVVFADETGIPQAGLDLLGTLGATITSSYDALGVVFATGVDEGELETLRSSSLVAEAGPDYRLNWIPDLVTGDVVQVEDDGQTHAHDPTAASRFDSWQWGPQRIAADQAWAAGHTGNESIRVPSWTPGSTCCSGSSAGTNYGRINAARAVN